MWVALLLVLNLAGTPCGTPDDPGFVMFDGTCMTVSRYNDMFSPESLAVVPSLVDPTRSVADVYAVPATPAATRQIGQGVLVDTFTFVEFVASHWPVE